jgi:hypothetical protein
MTVPSTTVYATRDRLLREISVPCGVYSSRGLVREEDVSDGDAMLLAIVRRKGSPEALADWLWERIPPADETPLRVGSRGTPAARVRSNGMVAEIYWFLSMRHGAWLRFNFEYGRGAARQEFRPLCFVPTGNYTGWPTGATLLAKHIREVFVKRRKK